MNAFIDDMEKHLSVTRTAYDLHEEWKLHAPDDCARSLETHLDKVRRRPLDYSTKRKKKKKRNFSANVILTQVLAHIQLYDSYHNRVPFRQDFQRAHGREPYANPMIRFKWFVCPSPLSISLHLSISLSLSISPSLSLHRVSSNTLIESRH